MLCSVAFGGWCPKRMNERTHYTVLSVFDGWLCFIGCIKWIASQANTMALSQIHWIWLCCCLFSLMLSLSSCANDNFYQIFVVFVVVSKINNKSNSTWPMQSFWSFTTTTKSICLYIFHLEIPLSPERMDDAMQTVLSSPRTFAFYPNDEDERSKEKDSSNKAKTKRAIHQPEIVSRRSSGSGKWNALDCGAASAAAVVQKKRANRKLPKNK